MYFSFLYEGIVNIMMVFSGSGSSYLYGFFDQVWKEGMTKDEAEVCNCWLMQIEKLVDTWNRCLMNHSGCLLDWSLLVVTCDVVPICNLVPLWGLSLTSENESKVFRLAFFCFFLLQVRQSHGYWGKNISCSVLFYMNL